MRILTTLAVLLATAASAHAVTKEINGSVGPCNAYPSSGRVANFPDGTYRLRGPHVNQQVRVNRSGKDYAIVAVPHKASAALFSLGQNLYVLRTQDATQTECIFTLAKRKGDILHVYASYGPSISVAEKFGYARGMPLERLPSNTDAAVNQRFFKALAPYTEESDLIFTATPVKAQSR